jgi:hypothetical protein
VPDLDPERARLVDADAGRVAWRHWGPYLSERAWGTVREDYSEGGTAWTYLPHDDARSRAYRWSDDGLAGICDDQQTLCFALAFWNGVDPVLKERIFGLPGDGPDRGNHGEDAKEYWWYLDNTPTHSWMRWRYVYPQQAYPYTQILAENRRRTRADPEYELLDTGVLEGGYWDVTAEYAKAAPEDICARVVVRNSGPAAATLHVLPTLWFRNTWSWGTGSAKPSISVHDGAMVAVHRRLGTRTLVSDGTPTLLGCENESNARRLWSCDGGTRFPKDGINDHLLHGDDTVSPDGSGTKVAFHHQLTVAAGATAEIRLRLAETGGPLDDAAFGAVMDARRGEADAFYAALAPPGMTEDEALVMRQAFAGMLWSKQFYSFDVPRWLDGDPGAPPPPAARLTGRNAHWRHLNNHDVISMPDKWEYPWYAAWDLAFHTVALAHLDAEFAKGQLILLAREWFMHPNGQLPAYEWAFGDVNPPVHAWAALRVFEIAGDDDYHFLERVFHKLLINFTWWVNRKDAEGNNLFQGGFLGLDNIGPFDRSAVLPVAGRLDQADGTAWMAMYCLDMLEIALVLAGHDDTYEDVATKFFEHFTLIASAMNQRGLWDEEDGFYHDVLHQDDGATVPVRARSIVGLLPLCATTTLGDATLARLPGFAERLRWFLRYQPEAAQAVSVSALPHGEGQQRLLSIVSPERLRRLLAPMLDEAEFLSPHGLRALSRHHLAHPLRLDLGGRVETLDYEPAETSTGLFGGNSNWRGPVWMPVNYLLVESLRRFAPYVGDGFTVELPTGSGRQCTLPQVADALAERLCALFLRDAEGRRPAFGDDERFQSDPAFRDTLLFHEYFHGDTGKGLGASHQTGWTGLVANLLLRRARTRAGLDTP